MTEKYKFNPRFYHQPLTRILTQLDKGKPTVKQLTWLLKNYPKDNQGFFTKNDLIAAFKHYQSQLKLKTSLREFQTWLQKKPVRSQSGVAVVTTLTKPFPCPGKCIFCPSDVRMPKSYLADEPGAQRAAKNAFDPYLQTYNRLESLHTNGHDTSKIELIILGGTWSYYPENYQLWFVKRSFDALNDFGAGIDSRSKVTIGFDFQNHSETVKGDHITKTYNQLISERLVTTTKKDSPSYQLRGAGGVNQPLLNPWEHSTWKELIKAQKQNETANCRCVGLVLETRPDNISPGEVTKLRRLGATKTQIGIQSLSDRVLNLNHRGHSVAATRRAFKLLRLAGFKIHAHWMPNLYGSNPNQDITDYQKLFSDPDLKPDELKIYPCSLIQSAELMAYYQKGLWKPYSHNQLLKVLSACLQLTPAYCRLTRIIRDIPGTEIVVGNKATNFRQIVEKDLDQKQIPVREIHSREIKNKPFNRLAIKLKVISYHTSVSTEKFLQFVTPQDEILAFLRLSLPTPSNHLTIKPFIPELESSGIIREIHVYGGVVGVGESSSGKPQHLGLGKKLMKKAIAISKKADYHHLAVISAIGTRQYYRKLGFTDGKLYQHYKLTS